MYTPSSSCLRACASSRSKGITLVAMCAASRVHPSLACLRTASCTAAARKPCGWPSAARRKETGLCPLAIGVICSARSSTEDSHGPRLEPPTCRATAAHSAGTWARASERSISAPPAGSSVPSSSASCTWRTERRRCESSRSSSSISTSSARLSGRGPPSARSVFCRSACEKSIVGCRASISLIGTKIVDTSDMAELPPSASTVGLAPPAARWMLARASSALSAACARATRSACACSPKADGSSVAGMASNAARAPARSVASGSG
mmetsp:Transcript_43501/g.107603  ORF Transcript_43501/g.107603 Transcript_43501/m.107603 type:complete len:265 (+) Transcript_43501:556-1350(+)